MDSGPMKRMQGQKWETERTKTMERKPRRTVKQIPSATTPTLLRSVVAAAIGDTNERRAGNEHDETNVVD